MREHSPLRCVFFKCGQYGLHLQHLLQEYVFRGEMDEKFIDNIVYVSSVVCYNTNLYIAIKFPGCQYSCCTALLVILGTS